MSEGPEMQARPCSLMTETERQNEVLREACGKLYRLASCACLSDRVMCRDCELLGEGVPCDLTRIREMMRELRIMPVLPDAEPQDDAPGFEIDWEATAENLACEYHTLRKLVLYMHLVMTVSCAEGHDFEPRPVSRRELREVRERMQSAGIEVC